MTSTATAPAWTVTRYPSATNHLRVKIIAVRGEGRNRQVINVELTPCAAEIFDADQYWAIR